MVDVDGKAIGRRVRAEREARGWNQSDLWRRSGVSVSYINRLENGRYTTPSLRQIQKLADALGRSVLDLTGPQPEPLPADLVEQVAALVGADDGLMRAIIAEIMRYPADQRAAALRFTLQSLQLIRNAPVPTPS